MALSKIQYTTAPRDRTNIHNTNVDFLQAGTSAQLPIGQAAGSDPTWSTVSGDVTISSSGVTAVGAGKVTGAMRKEGKSYGCVVVPATNGTTPVNVFGAGGAPCALTVTGGFVVALDTTASNIVMKQASNTVFTAAKGTTAGLSTTMGTLTNATYAASDVCTVESSGSGNALVVIFFTVA